MFHELDGVRLTRRDGDVRVLGSRVFVPRWRSAQVRAPDLLLLETVFETFYSVMEVRFEAK